jgi:dissimilatory sulfite reductase (desulfoviridin) alpha/beta subunit
VLVENAQTEEEVLAIVERVLSWYRNCGREVRLGRIVEELGIERFREEVLK